MSHVNTAAVVEAPVRVRYAETDQMGVVYHSNYIIWFEVGRVELLRSLGYTYREMEKDGVQLPVVEVRCRYKQPARYDDALVVHSRILNLRESLIRFGYEVVRTEDGAVLAEGESTHFVVGADLQKISFPEKYMVPFRAAVGD